MLKWFKRERAAKAEGPARSVSDRPVSGRREFFKASAGAVAGGAALVAGTPEAEAASVEGGAGYRETDHVRRYYDSARM